DDGRLRKARHRLDRNRETSGDSEALHRDAVSADARSACLSSRERLQDLHRIRRRRRVHATLARESLWHPPRAGRGEQRQIEIRSARWNTYADEAAGAAFL